MQRRTRVQAMVAAGMVSAALAGTAFLGADPLAAAPPAEHCVVRIVGRASSGELRTSAPVCAPTRAAALGRSGATAAGEWAIGNHFDGQNLTGGSFTVVGTSCVGGWLNLPPEWINRVSSTLHGCPHIRHFDGYNLVSPNQMTVYPGGNLLSTLNNRTNSIQYLP